MVTTVGTVDEARRLAKALIERKLAACAQLNQIESYYYWDGALQHEPEVRVLFKTVKRNQAALEAGIRELHPYEVPAIAAFDMSAVNAPYAEWVAENCRNS